MGKSAYKILTIVTISVFCLTPAAFAVLPAECGSITAKEQCAGCKGDAATIENIKLTCQVHFLTIQSGDGTCAVPKDPADCLKPCASRKEQNDCNARYEGSGGGGSDRYREPESERAIILRACQSGTGGYTPAECARVRNNAIGNDPFESRCQSRSDKYDDEFRKTNAVCQNGDTGRSNRFPMETTFFGQSMNGGSQSTRQTCYDQLDQCRQQMYRMSAINGNSAQVVAQYSQALNQIGAVSPICAQAIAGRDAETNNKIRDKAQDSIDDIEKELREMNKDAMKDAQALSKELADLNKDAADKVRELAKQASDLDTDMRRTADKAERDEFQMTEKFKENARKAREQMDEYQSELRKIKEVLPSKINMEYEIEVAKIASQCLERGRADADRRKEERELKKRGYRFQTATLTGLIGTQNSGSAKSRYTIDRKHAEKLCLQDRKPILDSLATKKAMELKLAQDSELRLLDRVKVLEITMQDLVEAAKQQAELSKTAAATEIYDLAKKQQFAVAESTFTQQFAYQRSSQMQQEAYQKGQMMQGIMWELDNKKREANFTLVTLPEIRATKDDYDDFQDALRGYNNMTNLRGGQQCCTKGLSATADDAFCKNPGGGTRTGITFPPWRGTN